MENIEEKKLIDACQAGDLEKFGALYDFYAGRIYRFVYFKTHHRETAQDLTSQTFFKALENIKKFNPEKGMFSSWLYRIAANTIIDYWRTKKRELNVEDIWDLKGKENIAVDAENRERLTRVKEYLKNFSREQREIVLMRIWDGLSWKEISEISGKSEGSCKMMFLRALAHLRRNEILAILTLAVLFKIN